MIQHMLCDIHIHSLASGHAFNTVDEITSFARANNYSIVGVAEHGPDMEGAPHLGYFEMLYRLPKRVGDMSVMHGCEANILNINGGIDIPDKILAGLDYVIAGLHLRTSYSGFSAEEHTRAIVYAISSGKVDIISHPVSLRFLANTDEITTAAAECGVALEANKTVLLEAVQRKNENVVKAYQELLELAKSKKVDVLFGSDAHHISEMGILSEERKVLADVYNITNCSFLNSSPEKLLAFLKKRRKIRCDVING